MLSSRIVVGLFVVWCLILGGVYQKDQYQKNQVETVYVPLQNGIHAAIQSTIAPTSPKSYESSSLFELEIILQSEAVKDFLNQTECQPLSARLHQFVETADLARYPLSNTQRTSFHEEATSLLENIETVYADHNDATSFGWLFWTTLFMGGAGFAYACWRKHSEEQQKIVALEQMIEEDTNQLETHTAFANQIGGGDLNIEVNNLAENDTLGHALVQMRDNLKKMSEEDDKRNWITQGLAQFSDLLREKNQSLVELGDAVISNLVNYLGATQGAIFLLEKQDNEPDGQAKSKDIGNLRLISCYAYDRKKFEKRTIEPGEGLVGQAYLEKAPIYLTEVPQNYTRITSGLGGSTPCCVFIVPLLLNEKVYGVIELAAFKPLEKHQQSFVEQLGESIASTVSTAQTNQLTLQLLHSSQQMTEELRSQEEELRQNLEELRTTQEQMERKEAELYARNQAVDTTLATAEFDMELKLLQANSIFMQLLGYHEGELEGLDHRALMANHYKETSEYQEFRHEVREGKVQVGEYEHRCLNGETRVFRSAYSVIRDSQQNPVKILLVGNDITQTRQLLTELQEQKTEIESIRVAEKKRADQEIADLNAKAMALVDEIRQQKDEVEQIRLDEKKRSDQEIDSLNELMNDYMMQNQQENAKLKTKIKELELVLEESGDVKVPVNGKSTIVKPRRLNGTKPG
ncbi:MAG: GAF domain-containing protein [Salibacteraceae bacterium]